MGFFTSYARLVAMTDEMQGQSDVKGSMATMTEKMNAAKASMSAANAAQAAAANPGSRIDHVLATAIIATVVPNQTWVAGGQLTDMTLTVSIPGGVMLPVSTTQLVSPQNMLVLRPGAQLTVTLDPKNPASVAIVW